MQSVLTASLFYCSTSASCDGVHSFTSNSNPFRLTSTRSNDDDDDDDDDDDQWKLSLLLLTTVFAAGCCRHVHGSKCEFSNSPNNYCLRAHGAEELGEWKERYEWRMMKKERAKFCHLYCYMDRLLDDYNSSLCKTSIVSTCTFECHRVTLYLHQCYFYLRKAGLYFVCLLAGSRKDYLIGFHTIRWKGGTRTDPRPRRNPLDCNGNPGPVTLGQGLR